MANNRSYLMHVSFSIRVEEESEHEAVAAAAYVVKYGSRETKDLSVMVLSSQAIEVKGEPEAPEVIPPPPAPVAGPPLSMEDVREIADGSFQKALREVDDIPF